MRDGWLDRLVCAVVMGLRGVGRDGSVAAMAMVTVGDFSRVNG